MDLKEKIKKELSVNNFFSREKEYRIQVSFHVDLLTDDRIDMIDIPIESWQNQRKEDHKIYDLLNYQLKETERVISDVGLNISKVAIQGENLLATNRVEVRIFEEELKRSSNRVKVFLTVPNLQYTQDKVTEYASKHLSIIYSDLFNIVKQRKLLAEILEIEETEDDEILMEEFVNKYKDLCFASIEKERVILDKLKKRLIFVLEKHNKLRN